MWRNWVLPIAGLSLAAVACSQTQSADARGEVGEVRVTLARVPADVSCVHVAVSGANGGVDQPFDVIPGKSAMLEVASAPVGADRVGAQTFSVPCSAVVPGLRPNWVASTVSTNVQHGTMAHVTLVMYRDGSTAGCAVPYETNDAGVVVTNRPAFREFATPTPNATPWGIAVGPDGQLWFTEASANKIGSVTTTGTVTEYPIPAPGPNNTPYTITAGPDGNLWFTEGSSIGRLDPSTGQISLFPLPTDFSHLAVGITAGPDSNLWYTVANLDTGADAIGRMSTAGTVLAELTAPSGLLLRDIVTGPDGNLWCVTTGSGYATGGLVRFSFATGQFDVFPSQTPLGGHYGLSVGFGQDLWFTIGDTDTDRPGNFIARISFRRSQAVTTPSSIPRLRTARRPIRITTPTRGRTSTGSAARS
jgi:streptogramin lyase